MRVYIFALIVFTIGLLILATLTLVSCCRARVSNIIRKTISNTFFNGVLSSVQLSYLPLCLTAVMQIRTYIDETG